MPSDDDQPGAYGYLTFNSPLSERRAEDIANTLAALKPATVLDVGCGWAELLVRIVERCDAHGIGVDDDPRSTTRAARTIAERGLTDRVEIITDIGHVIEPADVVVCSGSSQVFGTTAEALVALYDLVKPGGRVLFADGFWEPTAPQGDDSVPGDMFEMADLPGLVDEAIAAGFRPLRIETATPEEWERFESGYLADWEEWLVNHADHPDFDAIRAKADHHRSRWLRGYRHALGYAYLLLGRPR